MIYYWNKKNENENKRKYYFFSVFVKEIVFLSLIEFIGNLA